MCIIQWHFIYKYVFSYFTNDNNWKFVKVGQNIQILRGCPTFKWTTLYMNISSFNIFWTWLDLPTRKLGKTDEISEHFEMVPDRLIHRIERCINNSFEYVTSQNKTLLLSYCQCMQPILHNLCKKNNVLCDFYNNIINFFINVFHNRNIYF